MHENTLLVVKKGRCMDVTINRPDANNALNNQLIDELLNVITQAEDDDGIQAITLQGQAGYFCIGMDFDEFTSSLQQNEIEHAPKFTELLQRMAATPIAMIAILDGVVKAGGMGLVAACDIVISTRQSTFTLSEALWGLLPAQILPYIVRRVGFQFAYRMTMSCETINAEEAALRQFVDILDDNVEMVARRLLVKIARVPKNTRAEMKQFFSILSLLHDELANSARETFLRLAQEPDTKKRIINYVKDGTLPWESK